MLAEAALDVPALMIKDIGKVLAQGSPVGCLRPAPPGVSSVQSNNAAPDAKIVAAEAMVVLGVVACIRQNCAQIHKRGGLAQRGREVRRVLAGPDASDRAKDQMRVDVENRSELWPSPLSVIRTFAFATAFAEILAHVPRLQSGRIHCHGR
jgi:hypothetical protein